LDSVKIADIIVVDHYGIDEDWEVAFSKQKDKLVVVMDDLADRAHSCSILIDQNYYSDMKTRYTGKVGREAMLLLGPEFAIIRPQFKDFSKRNGSASREPLVPLNILISFGGSDKSGYGLMISRCILGSPLGSFVRCKLMGEYSSLDQKEKLLELAKRFPHSFEYLGFSEAPWECMSDAELYIGAGGSTTWERCCMGLSAIVFSISKNQEKMSQEFADAGYQIYLGSIESMVEGKLIAAIKDVLEHSELRLRFRNCSQSLVDGGGASRVAETIIASAKIFR
ncbi:MAG: glycosyltransferase, partial [Proteobacteria bacterium]|nr:glycosyltransferase [Pseudomonadota bacterium]